MGVIAAAAAAFVVAVNVAKVDGEALTARPSHGELVVMLFFRFTCSVHLMFWVLSLVTPLDLHAQREKFPMEDLEIITKQWPTLARTATGLRTLTINPGKGAVPKPGDNVVVRYKGALLDGKVFDQNINRDPFTFHVGRHEVIEGWDEGLQLMKVGEKRLLVVPSELAYGAHGRPPVIPRNASLVFEVELLEIKPPVAPVGGK